MSKRWEVIGKQGTAIWEGDEIVAQMNNPRTNHKNARRNAVLMASAPELLAACKQAEKLIRNGGVVPIQGKTWEALTAAIADATSP